MKKAWKAFRSDRCGQATVEGAFLIPAFFLLIILLIQPGILLYNLMVMQAAASEGCRLLVTKTEMLGTSDEKCKGYILRRLSSVPEQENFHIHEGSCSWEIQMQGDETTGEVSVTIKNQVKLLPLLDTGGVLLGFTGNSGNLEQEVEIRMASQPDWVIQTEEGLNPHEWVEQWR